MKGPIKILLLGAGGLIAVVAVCFFCLREKEPSYNGRTLSEWLEIADSYKWSAERYEAQQAVSAIGINAIPTYLEWSSERSLSRKDRCMRLYKSLPSFVRGNELVSHWLLRDSTRLNYMLNGVHILGTNATIALPELARRFNSSTNEEFVYYTAFFIGHLGKPGLNFLTSVLQKKAAPRRDVALHIIGSTMRYSLSPEEAKLAVPIMLSVLNDVSDPLASRAANELGKLGAAPEQVVPQLINALGSTNVAMRIGAIQGLMEFRTNANMAIPAIHVATRDNDANVRSLALAALPLIAPETPTKK